MKYYIETPRGPVEISRLEYINLKIDELMGTSLDYSPFMKYLETEIDLTDWRLPKGV